MDVFVARQPIFDKSLKVVAYELLYREGEENRYGDEDGDRATSRVVTNSFLRIGIEKLTGGKKAFINFTEKLIKEEIPTIFPKELIVVEILENIVPDQNVIQACLHLKKKGYVLALDDYIFHSPYDYQELFALVDIIKVDFLSNTVEDRKSIPKKISNKKIKFLAEKVETKEEFEEAIQAGYTYFQGYFFSRPIVVSGKEVPAYKTNYIRVLEEIHRENPDFDKIAQIIETDVSLSYELLRLIHSAAFHPVSKITSIKLAIARLGLKEMKKWIGLMMIRDLAKDKPDELMRSALIRARFGELLAEKIGHGNRRSEVFLMGMFSYIDVLLERPLGEILEHLPLSQEIVDALLGYGGEYHHLYQLIKAYEKGKWKDVFSLTETLKIEEKLLPKFYVDAIDWTNQIFSFTNRL